VRDHALPPAGDGSETLHGRTPEGTPAIEDIIARANTPMLVGYLQLAQTRARLVVRLKREDGYVSTGFLADGNTIITCNHMNPDVEAARLTIVQFNFEETATGEMARIEEFRLLPEAFCRTSVADDWTAVRVEGDPPQTWGTLALKVPPAVSVGNALNLILHRSSDQNESRCPPTWSRVSMQLAYST
jgi:hypothetical protein